MHKKLPKICTGCRVIAAKIYLHHSTKIAKARPHSVEWQTDSSVQKQWFMPYVTTFLWNMECSNAQQTWILPNQAYFITKRKHAKYCIIYLCPIFL